MRSRGAAEYRALSYALDHVTPPCSDDPRFSLDPREIAPDELNHIGATICRRCPIKPACRAYGDTARPLAGIWAGKTYKPMQGRTRGETT